ncbi:alpha/beta-hydrolase [Violaceomyces palustris]|uniref:Alpha/beta-hydrolase n=1 Tax=Violaceomyces palustris TaxID=1673888 RepID=A0ACD0NPM6_9BASI|nr:alpha/beta-hydrolase [Violaceomyces palustris]
MSSQDQELADLKEKLQSLHDDELPATAKRGTALQGWFMLVIDDTFTYIQFIVRTWGQAILSTPFYILDPFNLGVIYAFATLSTIILAFMLLFAIFAHFPFVQDVWDMLSKRLGGVSLASFAYPQIFSSLSSEIREAAYATMSDPLKASSQPSTQDIRNFDLEIAKVLMCTSALVYERNVRHFTDAVKLAKKAKITPEIIVKSAVKDGMPSALLKLSLAGDPKTRTAITNKVKDADEKIIAVAKDWGLEYVSLSELATNTSPVCGAFFSRHHNFIILSFKGTNPIEFKEWVLDFTYSWTDPRNWLPNYGRMHKGFYESLFPPDVSDLPGNRTPYDTIRLAVQFISEYLSRNSPDRMVNLYVTGHSLGTALASTFYARAVGFPQDFGKSSKGENLVRVRDAYCFATPIFGDPDCVKAFNSSLYSDLNNPVTLWRVTNRHDAVATMLPEGGDYNFGSHISPTSQFHYAHLGQEIQMRRDVKTVGTGPGTMLPKGARCRVITHLGNSDGTGPKVDLPLWYRILENTPLIGRGVGHVASSYWKRLSLVQVTNRLPYLDREHIWQDN